MASTTTMFPSRLLTLVHHGVGPTDVFTRSITVVERWEEEWEVTLPAYKRDRRCGYQLVIIGGCDWVLDIVQSESKTRVRINKMGRIPGKPSPKIPDSLRK